MANLVLAFATQESMQPSLLTATALSIRSRKGNPSADGGHALTQL